MEIDLKDINLIKAIFNVLNIELMKEPQKYYVLIQKIQKAIKDYKGVNNED